MSDPKEAIHISQLVTELTCLGYEEEEAKEGLREMLCDPDCDFNWNVMLSVTQAATRKIEALKIEKAVREEEKAERQLREDRAALRNNQ